MRKSRSLVAVIFGCAALFGQVAASAEAWGTSTVKFVYPLPDGSVVVGFDSEVASCTNGSTPKYYYIRVGENGMTAEGLKNLLSVFLLALATDKAVSFVFDTSTSYCYINRASVAR